MKLTHPFLFVLSLSVFALPLHAQLEWEFQTIEDGFQYINASMHITLDDENTVHIVHGLSNVFNGSSKSERGRYSFQEFESSYWQSVDAQNLNYSGGGLSMDIDPEGVVSIINLIDGSLYFSQYIDGSWESEFIYDNPLESRNSALFITNEGIPHVVFLGNHTENNGGNLMYAVRYNETWEVSVADTTKNSGTDLSITVDRLRVPHILHKENTTVDFSVGPRYQKYTTLKNGVWHNEIVYELTHATNSAGSNILIDNNNMIHLAFMYHTCNGWGGVNKVIYGYGESGNWNFKTIDETECAARVSMVLDGCNSPHFIYGTKALLLGGNSELRYAYTGNYNNLVREVINQEPGDVGESNDMTIDNDGFLHITFYEGNQISQAGKIKYAKSTIPTCQLTSVQNKPSTNFFVSTAPNPFRYNCNISFFVQEPALLSIQILDIYGRLIKSLKNDFHQTGEHSITWDGNNSENQMVAAGMYYVNIKSKNGNSTLPLVFSHN